LVHAAFRVRDGSCLSGRAVVLVDDVVTTGATAAACIEVMRRAGAEVVAVVAVARAGI
jgi:predicted amidophosphoribosyltransferase